MRHVLFISVSVLALTAAAEANDRNARANPAPFSWGGHYIGAFVGGGWNTTHSFMTIPDISGDNGGDEIVPLDALSTVSFPNQPFDANGLVAGLSFGANWTHGGNWVFGLQGDVAASGVAGAATSEDLYGSEIEWTISVRGRIGYAFDRIMLFATGGAAGAGIKLNQFEATRHTTRGGWVIGGGAEWAFADQWSLKLEYLHFDFGSASIQATEFGGTDTFANVLNTVTIGVNHRF
jgi:outer membrane immunogenic protein